MQIVISADEYPAGWMYDSADQPVRTGSSGGRSPITSSPSGRAAGWAPTRPKASFRWMLSPARPVPSGASGLIPASPWRGGKEWNIPYPTTGTYSSPGSSARSKLVTSGHGFGLAPGNDGLSIAAGVQASPPIFFHGGMKPSGWTRLADIREGRRGVRRLPSL